MATYSLFRVVPRTYEHMKSLDEEIESLNTGESCLNTQLSIAIDLKKSFEKLKQEVEVITLET